MGAHRGPQDHYLDWTPERIATLRKLWDEGLSSGVIAQRMGLTKNAICGKARRLGLPCRPTPIIRTGPSPTKQQRRETALVVAGPVERRRGRKPAAPIEVIRPLLEAGKDRAEIAEAVGITRDALNHMIKRAGLAKPRKPTEEEKQAWRARGANRGYLARANGMAKPLALSAGPRPKECQWIEGEPTGHDTCKCMRPVASGSSYCAEHRARCVRVVTERQADAEAADVARAA